MRRLLLASAIALVSLPAYATQWTVDTVTSRLTFKGTQSDEAFAGEFKRFTPTINFDSKNLSASTIDLVIDMTSATIDGKDRAESLPTADWFATGKFPKAEFHSTNITSKGGNSYSTDGNLTIRGITKPVTLNFTLTETAAKAHAIGTATLNRTDYGIGQGRWTSDEWVKYPVAVEFEIRATAK